MCHIWSYLISPLIVIYTYLEQLNACTDQKNVKTELWFPYCLLWYGGGQSAILVILYSSPKPDLVRQSEFSSCWSTKAFEQEKHFSYLKALRFGSYLLWKESLFLSDWFNYKFSLSYKYIDLYCWSSIIFNQNGCLMIFECYINVYVNTYMNYTHLYRVCMHVYFYVCGSYENIKMMLRGEKVILKEVEIG